MAHDVLWLSTRSDHPDEIAVHMEDGRNPDRSEAGNTGSLTWPCSCGASSLVVSALGLARFRISAQFFWQARSCLTGKKNPRSRQRDAHEGLARLSAVFENLQASLLAKVGSVEQRRRIKPS